MYIIYIHISPLKRWRNVSVDRRLLLFNAGEPHGPKYRSHRPSIPHSSELPPTQESSMTSRHIFPFLGQYADFPIPAPINPPSSPLPTVNYFPSISRISIPSFQRYKKYRSSFIDPNTRNIIIRFQVSAPPRFISIAADFEDSRILPSMSLDR